MYCTSCGSQINEGEKFCRNCGAPTRMENKIESGGFIKATAKAIGYFLIMPAWQFIVSFVYMLSASFAAIGTIIGSGASLSDPEFARLLTEELMSSLNPIILISAALTLGTYLIIFLARKKNPLCEVRLTSAKPHKLFCGLIIGASLQLFFCITINFLSSILPPRFFSSMEQNGALIENSPLWLSLISLAVVTPVLEEVVFRGLVYTRLTKGMRRGTAVLLSSIIFGIAHGNVIAFVYAGLFGVVLACLLERSGSIIPGILAHAAFNAVSVCMEYIMPENPLLVLAVYFVSMAAAVISIYFALRKDNATPERI